MTRTRKLAALLGPRAVVDRNRHAVNRTPTRDVLVADNCSSDLFLNTGYEFVVGENLKPIMSAY